MSEPFLRQVARHFFEEYGADIARLRFVFPSKRALTFFRHYLSQLASERPIFAPQLETMSSFIARLAPPVKLLDKTALLFELYASYREVRRARGLEVESLDNFLYWGGLILKDFDSCDRYLVNIHHLYTNLRDLKELSDDFSYLSEEARQLIESFWGTIPALAKRDEAEQAAYQERFLSFWDSLAPLYAHFTSRLLSQGLAYEGHLYRLAAEAKEEILGRLDERELVFVGLFQLTPAERRIFCTLRQAGRARFCWDSQVAIVQDGEHPASHYYSQLVKDFGQVEGPWASSTLTSSLPQRLEVVQCPSPLAQTKGLPTLFDRLGVSQQAARLQAALVLPDEGLLLPTASSLPHTLGAVNITLGYPLDKTPIARLLHQWISLLEYSQRRQQGVRYPANQLLGLLGQRLITEHCPEAIRAMQVIRAQKRFYIPPTLLWEETEAPLLHLLLDPLSHGAELLSRMEKLLHALIEESARERETEETEELSSASSDRLTSFDIEFIHHYLRLVKRLQGLSTTYLAQLELSSVVHLLQGLSGMVTIPFEGDPLEGLQVMGLLETRGLHFDTMIYLGAQEGSLPSTRHSDTLIPFTLRRAFGLPIRGADDLGADYTFFQSIARAQELIFVVAPAKEASSVGEESRYIHLLHYLYGCPIQRHSLRLSSQLRKIPPRSIPKQGEAWERFVQQKCSTATSPQQRESILSPSALATFVQCPLRFYYEKVCGVQEETEPSLLLESNELGDIVHRTLESIYNQLAPPSSSPQGQTYIQKRDLEQLKKDSRYIARQVEEAYRHEMKLPPGPLSNLANIYCKLIERYISAILQVDIEYAPFYYIASEKRLSLPFPLGDGRHVHIGGIIDRIDLKEETFRIVDYKTGKAELKLDQWDNLCDPKYKAILQTLIYCEIFQEKELKEKAQEHKLYPAIYRLNEKGGILQQQEKYDARLRLPMPGEPTSDPPKDKNTLLVYDDIAVTFRDRLTKKILTPLFDESIPFKATEEEKNCTYCPFASSCGR